ncbi:hypothetical protein M0R45_036399 [Rubus argutus]|uniref:Uncharacterized protein n=1 Tax=Rubus argutus TaxID=59490 RepID=A0AAW1VZJ5_RUBAR
MERRNAAAALMRTHGLGGGEGARRGGERASSSGVVADSFSFPEKAAWIAERSKGSAVTTERGGAGWEAGDVIWVDPAGHGSGHRHI